MNDNEKMLRLMRFWLFGTFLIIFIATIVYLGAAVGTGLAILGQFRFWLAFVIAGVLCVVWYNVYKWYLQRDK
jgi:hypothetical protein